MPPAKHRVPIIPLKVKKAVEVLLGQATYDLPAAAKEAGLTTYRLREYLMRAEVLRFVREEKAALVERICLSNPHALAEVRSTSPNSMARVASARQLELLRTGAFEEAGGAQQRTPSLQIVIVQQRDGMIERTVGPPPMIEHDPLGEPELESPGR